jgi:hypothetical protein
VSLGEGGLTDRRCQLPGSQNEDFGLAQESAPTQRQVASSSSVGNLGRTSKADDFEVALNNGDILEIPDGCQPDASSAKAENRGGSQPAWSFRSAWLKLAFLVLGSLGLLIWLVAPRSGPGLHETPGAEEERWGAVPVGIEKAESAMADSRYVTPVDDNVVLLAVSWRAILRTLKPESLRSKASRKPSSRPRSLRARHDTITRVTFTKRCLTCPPQRV